RIDLAVGDGGSNEVSILLSNGDGTFQPAVQYAVGTGPEAIVAGGFNGDGHLDLALAHLEFSDVSQRLGEGDAALAPSVRQRRGGDQRRWWRATARATATSTWPWQAATTTQSPKLQWAKSGCCGAMVTAPSNPPSSTRWDLSHFPSWRVTSPATVILTSPLPTG